MKTKSSYSFEDRGTNGETQAESISECRTTLKQLSNGI